MAANPYDDPNLGLPAAGSNPYDNPDLGKKQGAIGYLASQAKAGLTADLPTIAGKALQYAGATDIGGRIRAYGEANAANAQPDENQGAVTKMVAGAIRGAAPIVPLAVGGLLAQGTPVGPALDVAGAAALAGGFGASQAQDTLEKAKAAGLSDEAATSAARKTGLITGVGMGAVGALTGGAAAPAIRALAGTGARTAAETLAETAAPSLARPLIADTAGHLVGNVASMAAANAGTAAVEQQAGLPGPTPGEAALEGVESGAGLTAALLPFGAARTILARRANVAAVNRLQSPDTDPEARMQVAQQIHANLSAIDPAAADHFANNVVQAIDLKQPVALGEHLLKPFEPTPVEKPAATPPEAPDLTTSAGAGVPPAPGSVDFERQVDTSDLALAPITIDEQGHVRPNETIPSGPDPAIIEQRAENYYNAGNRAIDEGRKEEGLHLMEQGDAILRGEQPKPFAPEPTPAQKMGIDANAGPISRAAAIAVDSGAHDLAKAQVADEEAAKTAPKEPANAEKTAAQQAGPAALAQVGSAQPGEAVPAARAAAENAQAAGVKPAKEATSAKAATEQTARAAPDAAGAAGPKGAEVQPASDRAAAPAAEKPAPALTPRTGEGSASILAALAKQRDVKPAVVPDASTTEGRSTTSTAQPADILNTEGAPFRNRLAAGAALKKAGPGHEVAPLAEGGFVVRALPKEAAKPVEPKALHVGITPGNAEPVTVKDGIVHIGKSEAVNFDSGEAVRVKAGATDTEVKQALKDAGALSRRQKFFGGEPDTPNNKMPVGAPKGPAGGKNARSAAYEANPLKAFIAQHGLAPELAQEFAPGIRERRSAMVPGYGPIFRKGGLQMDALAERAAQDGFLPPGDHDANRLYDLVGRALRGERIIPIYAEGAVDKEMQKRMDAMRDDKPVEGMADVRENELDALGNVPWDEPGNATLEGAMRSLGFTDKEITDAVAKESGSAQADREGRGQPDEAAAGKAAPGGGTGEAAQGAAEGLTTNQQPTASWVIREKATGKVIMETFDRKKVDALNTAKYEAVPIREHLAGINADLKAEREGLTAPSKADVLAQQAAKEQAPALDAKAQIDREAEKQTLTQPNATEQRKDSTGDMFARDKAQAELDKKNEGKPKDDGGTVPMFKRSAVDEGARMSAADLREALAPVLRKLKIPAGIHDTVEQARKASGFDVPDNVQGMHFDGKLHLIAEGLKSPLEAEQVLWHEVNHAGIDRMFGASKSTQDYQNAMRGLALQNENIRTAAKEWLRKFGADDTAARVAAGMPRDAAELRTKLQAVEEALSELAGRNAKINGATRFIAKVQEFMRAVGLNRLADSLEKMTDAQALAMIFKAREAVMKEPQQERAGQLAPAFSKDQTQFAREPRTVEVDGERRPIENSAGQPIVANHDTEKLKAFYKFFGESKVVDERGRPLVVYHSSTYGDVSVFDKAEQRKGMASFGFYFTDQVGANLYADLGMNFKMDRSWKGEEKKVNVMPVYLAMKNPLRADDIGEIHKQFGSRDPGAFGVGRSVAGLTDDEKTAIEKAGYDGVITTEKVIRLSDGSYVAATAGQRDAIKHPVYVVFSPNQIKSATGNRGTFDASNPNISFSRTLDKASDTLDRIKGAAITKDVGTAYDGILMATNPAARSDAAKEMARALISGQGEKEMKSIQFRTKLNAAIQETAKATTLGAKARDLMEKGLTVQADKVFLRNKPEENHAFMQAMDTGDEKYFAAHPDLKPMADVIARMFADKAKEIQGLGTGALENIRANYFPHLWNREPSGDKQREIFSTLAKRPLEGRKGFTKARVFDDVQAGLDAGFEPISNNPLDLVALKMEEMDKYLLAHKTLQAMEGSNGVHLIAAGEKTPQGFTDVNGRFGGIERNGEKLRYIARDDVAQVINNYLSPSLYHNKYVGKPFTAYMGAANTLNQFQLGVFSAFHAGFTSMEAVISHAAIGIKAATEGDFKGAAKYLGSAPAAWINNPKLGSKIIAHMMDSAAHPEMAPILEGLQMAGFKWQMDNRFRTDATKNMLQAWQDGNKFKAGLNSIPALAEQTARPILEWLVPRQKFGVFGEMYSKWMEDHPEATHEELRNSAQQIWNRVDSRLGQVVYDRLFVHNVAKNFAQMLIRAPGWTGGTILEVGGGIKDLAGYAKDLASGKKPAGISDRAAYTLSMLMITATANAAMTAMFTGEQPEDWRDLVAFRTGNLDEHGRPERFMLPTYMKDVYAYAKAPGTTLVNKAHPLLSLVGDIGKNKDFYGTEIRSEDANILTQLAQTAGFAAKAFVPFWMKGVQKEKEREGSALSMAAPLVGVMPAPSDLNKTAAEKLMTQYGADRMPQGSRTQEETDKADLRRQMYLALRKGEQDKAKEIFDQGRTQGLFGARDYLKVMRQARQDPLAAQFSHLTYDQAQRVMKVATDDEKKELAPAFMKKRLADQRQHAGS